MYYRSVAIVALFALAVTVALRFAMAAEVTHAKITGLHLCCRTCCEAVEEALKEVDGVEDVQVAQKSRTVEFTVPSDTVLDVALGAVQEAGFSGKATSGGRNIEFPTAQVKPDTKSDLVVFTGVHLCCGGCAKAVAKALESQTGVIAVDCKIDERTVSLIGKDLEADVLLTALNKAGFHGKLEE